MVDGLLERIDISQLENALVNLQAITPPIIGEDDDNFTKFNPLAKLSLVQINYTDYDEYTLGKLYTNVGPETEIAFTADYAPHALNFYHDYADEVIFSYTVGGVELCEYFINRDELYHDTGNTYMVKSTGDIYQPYYRTSTDPIVEAMRALWGRNLLCYSLKQDGRRSFYIVAHHQLSVQVTSEQFI